MGRPPSLLMALIFIITTHHSYAQQNWDEPYFFLPPGGDPGNVQVLPPYDGGTFLQIFMDENVPDTSAVHLATMSYNGNKEPTLSFVGQGSNNEGLSSEQIPGNGTWKILLSKTYDAEIYDTFSVQVTEQDSQITCIINVYVRNFNDNSPVIAPPSTCQVSENHPVGQFIANCDITVFDADGVKLNGANMSLTVTSDFDYFEWLPQGSVGEDDTEMLTGLKLTHNLDYEVINLHSLTLTATNTDDPSLNSSVLLLLRVEDEPDTIPMWVQPPPATFDVDEGINASFTFSARDGDIGLNEQIMYSITDDSPAGVFTLADESNHAVLHVFVEDRDEGENPTLIPTVTVWATDSHSNISQKVSVIVKDVNDNEPKISSDTLTASITEEVADVLNFGEDVIITDLDLGINGQFKIELIADDVNMEGAFKVVPASGYQNQQVTISVVDASKINFETLSEPYQILLTLQATELKDETHIGTASITVTVINENDEYPVFVNSPYSESLREDAKQGDSVISVTATDGDIGDNITYSLLPVNAPVEIDPVTGEVTVKRDGAFDYELQQEVQVQIKAMDKANHSTFADLTITVVDLVDTQPSLTLNATNALKLLENSPEGTVVTNSNGSILASDADQNANLVFSILWDQSYATKRSIRVTDTTLYTECLTIDKIPGGDHQIGILANLVVADTAKIDYEKFDTLYVMINVEDEATEIGISNRNGLHTVELLDENDNPPEFNEEILNTPKNVLEGSPENTFIGYVIATDADFMDSSNISYALTAIPPTPENLVQIDPRSGELRTTSTPIDMETIQLLQYDVTASDGENDNVAVVNITVVDANDEVPVFVDPLPNEEFIVKEHEEEGSVIVDKMIATDGDISAPYSDVCYTLDPNYSGYASLSSIFNVNESNGQVTVKNSVELDREIYPSGITVHVLAYDNCHPEPGKTFRNNVTNYFRVQLEDINDKKPEFITPSQLPDVSENTPQNGMVYSRIEAVDDDQSGTPASTIEYTIQSQKDEIGEDVDLFKLKNNGDNTADLLAKAQDNGTDPGSKNTTKIFTLTLTDVNNNAPVFVFPNGDDIRLAKDCLVEGERLVAYTDNNCSTPVENVKATDADSGSNAAVTFEITGDSNAMIYIDIESTGSNEAKLILKKALDATSPSSFNLTIEATDEGSPVQSSQITSRVYITSSINVEPYYNKTVALDFLEGQDAYDPVLLPEAEDPNNIENPEEFQEPIYYYIFDAIEGDASLFAINKTKPELSVVGVLDREEYSLHQLRIVASNFDSMPISPDLGQFLYANVEILDIIDFVPYFQSELYVGGIAPSDTVNYEVLRITAIDKDEPDKDVLTYSIMEETMWATPDLEPYMNTAFSIETVRSGNNYIGILTTVFTPTNEEGYFKFNVSVTDSAEEPNSNSTEVQVYIIKDSNRVYFLFLNNVDEINANRENIIEIFSFHLGAECAIDEVKAVDDTSPTKATTNNRTSVRTHFIDPVLHLPVEGSVIEARATDLDTLVAMQEDLQEHDLRLVDVLTQSTDDPSNLTTVLTITLIVVTVVLGSLVIVLFIAFVIKTRSLNRRLKALSTTKFGSQESDLNRHGMNVPNTNKHAVEGSNPVWNENIPSLYDQISEGSGDSELIGVEDRPEFSYGTKDATDGMVHAGSHEGGYYSGSEATMGAHHNDNDLGIAMTEL